MVMTIIFILYALFFAFLCKSTLRKGVKLGTLIIISFPCFLIIWSGIVWGYTEQHYTWLRMSPGSNLSLVLILAVGAVLMLSYTVFYQVGYTKGYRASEKDQKARTH